MQAAIEAREAVFGRHPLDPVLLKGCQAAPHSADRILSPANDNIGDTGLDNATDILENDRRVVHDTILHHDFDGSSIADIL